MRLNRTIERLDSDDYARLSNGARDLGHELPRRRLMVIAAFRSELAAVQAVRHRDNEFALGYRQALLDLAAAYDAAVEEDVRKTMTELDEDDLPED